jgi:hypothetical protein
VQTTALTAELTGEFGDLVPATLIESTVRAAGSSTPGAATPDDSDVARTARADVAALAEAVRRRTEADSGR